MGTINDHLTLFNLKPLCIEDAAIFLVVLQNQWIRFT